jgi:hypothetical protein
MTCLSVATGGHCSASPKHNANPVRRPNMIFGVAIIGSKLAAEALRQAFFDFMVEGQNRCDVQHVVDVCPHRRFIEEGMIFNHQIA